MAVSDSYRDYVLDQLGRVRPVTWRKMFGGIGVYADGLFFALMDDDVLYFKVDDSNRPDFEALGMGPFRPFGNEQVMQYYEVPGDALEDVSALTTWMDAAIQVALTSKRSKKR